MLMNNLTRIAAMLTLAASFGFPLVAQAQSDVSSPAPSMGGHHHGHRDPFFRALRKLTLTDEQKQQIKSDVAASRKASQNATPDQRKANWEQLHKQIEALLTPAQQQQLQAELAHEKAMWKAHHGNGAMTPEPAAT